MHKKIALIATALFLTLIHTKAYAQLKTEDVKYQANNTTMQGYIAYDDAYKGKRPAVLVVHEWWGHNDYARKRADMLAKEGYIALAVDMYGQGKQASHPKDAMAFSSAVKQNMDAAEDRFKAAIALLKKHPMANDKTMSAIGYCFGGGIILEMLRRGVKLDVAASFHGSLSTQNPAAENSLEKTKVLVFNGAADKMVKAEHVTDVVNEMANAKAELTLVNYPNVLHAFSNPEADTFAKRFNIPLKYNQHADQDSWAKLINALQQQYK